MVRFGKGQEHDQLAVGPMDGTMAAGTLDAAVSFMALGLDPEKATFWVQSDVPEVQELAWMLSCVTGMGLLERAHSYKDKIQRGIVPRVGLFTYPVLMAADILIVRGDLVPVGQDQVQHIEMTQDMAAYFNNTYGCEVLRRPEPRLGSAPLVQRPPGPPGPWEWGGRRNRAGHHNGPWWRGPRFPFVRTGR